MNVPGPFYTVDPDSLFLASLTAPRHVGVDDQHCDVVYRQPITSAEWARMEDVATSDPMASFEMDGCAFWTRASVTEWRSSVPRIVRHIETRLLSPQWWRHDEERPIGRLIAASWLQFVANELDDYLARFAMYLDGGRWPGTSDALLEL